MDPFTEYEKTLPFSKIENEIVKLFSSVTLFVLILLPALFVPVCVNLFGFVEGAEVFTGIFFMILFSFSSAALCLFFQSIIENSLISLIFSVLCNVFFNFIHFFALSLNSSAVISKIVKALSFSWHFNSAKKGIFDSRDCLFFILFTVSCLLLNVYTSEIKKGKHFSKHRKQNAFLLSVILVFSFLNSTKYYFRKDFTLRKNYSLTSYSKKLLNENSSRLNITYFRNRELENLYPSVKDITDLLNEYAENPNVSVSVRDPVRKNEVQLLSNYQIYPRQIQQSRNGKTELINVYSCIFLEMNGKTEVIPFILSSKNLEFSVSEKLLKLISDNKRYVNILSGSGENVSENYSYLIEFLNSQGFSVNIIDNNFEIPSQLEAASEFGSLLLVLGHSNLSDSDTAAIETYLEKGNKIFFAVSPYEKDINETWHITKSKNQKLIRLIESYGIGFSKNIIKDLSSARILMQDENNNSTYLNYYLWPEILPQENAKNGMI